MGLRSAPSGRVEFIGEAAKMFRLHPFQGWYSGLERLAGQHVSKRVGYDIVFGAGNVYRHSNILRVSNAEFVRQSAGRFAWSYARYYSRLTFIDWGIPIAAGAAYYFRQDIANFIEGVEGE